MGKRNSFVIAAIILILLGFAMIYLGAFNAKLLLPPVITGLGFFVIAWVFLKMAK